jgi:predicted N-formylglutamate amidohydrolase
MMVRTPISRRKTIAPTRAPWNEGHRGGRAAPPATSIATATGMHSIGRAEPFEIVDGDYGRGLVLIVDHASNRLPDGYGTLGLDPSDFRRHIAYDIGIGEVARRIASRLRAPAVLCGFSRLLIDPNRGEDDPTLIRQLSDNTIIEGNYPLDAAERERRLDAWYRPYHRAIAGAIAEAESRSGMPPFLVSLHSFTPQMQGRSRPWHVSLLWDLDDRAARPLFEVLRGDKALCVGDNEPYDGALAGDTLSVHATSAGLAHVLIEIRQDLIADEKGQAEWAERLAPALDGINRRADIHQRRHFGSRAP